MEFRQHVRKLLGKEKADVKQVDELFDSLDEDRGGTLDVDEIRAALKRLMEDTHVERQNALRARESMARQQERIAMLRRARDITLEADPELMRPVDLKVLRGDNTRISTDTGWSPSIPIEQTLEDLLEFWRREDLP